MGFSQPAVSNVEKMEASLLHVASDGGGKHGAPSPTRTGDLRIRSPTLYPSELWAPPLISSMFSPLKVQLSLEWLRFCPVDNSIPLVPVRQ